MKLLNGLKTGGYLKPIFVSYYCCLGTNFLNKACNITSLVLVGLQYRFTNPDFTNTIWQYFSALITASTVWGSFVSTLGIKAFHSHNYKIIATVNRLFKLVCYLIIPIFIFLPCSRYNWNDCWNYRLC